MPLTPEQREKLKAAAEAANGLHDTFQPFVSYRGDLVVKTFSLQVDEVAHVANYYDAATPSVILAMLAQVEAMLHQPEQEPSLTPEAVANLIYRHTGISASQSPAECAELVRLVDAVAIFKTDSQCADCNGTRKVDGAPCRVCCPTDDGPGRESG